MSHYYPRHVSGLVPPEDGHVKAPKHVEDSNVTYMLLLNCALKLDEEIFLYLLYLLRSLLTSFNYSNGSSGWLNLKILWRSPYLLTYLLTPWSRVLLEKLTGSAASQEIPRIFGTRRFLTVPTSARHLSLS